MVNFFKIKEKFIKANGERSQADRQCFIYESDFYAMAETIERLMEDNADLKSFWFSAMRENKLLKEGKIKTD